MDATTKVAKQHLSVLAMEHPAYGCNCLEALLMLEGTRVLAIAMQKIVNDHEQGTREQRWPALERRNAGQAIKLIREQIDILKKQNQCFRER